MTEYTYSRRINQLIEQVRNHPQRDEILQLALEQMADDTDGINSQSFANS
jgi:hypothetical protein